MPMPKVSVVIPTRRRAETLAFALQTVMGQSHSNLEIIVSNNGGDDATRRLVEGVDDPRLRCVEPGGEVSMTDNFEYGLAQATGEWLVLIGDDDGILPTGIERGLKALRESGGEAVGSLSGLFVWPGNDNGPNASGTYLTVPTGRGWEWQESDRMMKRILDRKQGFQEAPVTYTGGIVSSALYRRIREIDGRFFHSQIPDVYSTFAILSVIDRYVFCREPLMIAGVSRHSHGNAGMQFKPNDFKELANIPFHPDLPLPKAGTFTFSFQALLYESYLQSAYLRRKPPLTGLADEAKKIIAWARYARHRSPAGPLVFEEVEDWARNVSKDNGATFAAWSGDADRMLPIMARRDRLSKFLYLVTRHFVDKQDRPSLTDIAAACVEAEAIRLRRPSRIGNLAHYGWRRMRRS